MASKKILIADTSVEFVDLLRQLLSRDHVLRVCHGGLPVMGLLEEFAPDVLVMDLVLSGMDGLSLLKQISALPSRPKVVLTTCYTSSYVEASIAGLGVDLLMLKPCNAEVLVERIDDLMTEENPRLMCIQPPTTVASMLLELNLPSKRRGFVYLEQAIKMRLEQPTLSLTKVVYPQIAKDHDTQQEAVERAIRQLVHESWENRDDSVWRRYFSPGREGVIPRPTNGEFISGLSEHYRLVREKQA